MFKAKLLEIEKAVDQLVVIGGRTFYAMSSSDARYEEFLQDHSAYLDGVAKVYTVIQDALNACVDSDAVYVFAKDMASGATDPESWAETLTIAAGKSKVSLIGIGDSITQGGVPQVKIGAGSTALLAVNAPGCLIKNLGFNGIDSTGGGISVPGGGFGTTIKDCHFKNCQGSGNASTGAAIVIDSVWNIVVDNCRFHKNRCSILSKAATDHCENVIIKDCIFGSNAKTEVDADIYGTPIRNIQITDCRFMLSDVPAYATSPAAARYIKFTVEGATDCFGSIQHCFFGCTAKTFGNGNAAVFPTTVTMAGCHQSVAVGAGATGEIGIT